MDRQGFPEDYGVRGKSTIMRVQPLPPSLIAGEQQFRAKNGEVLGI